MLVSTFGIWDWFCRPASCGPPPHLCRSCRHRSAASSLRCCCVPASWGCHLVIARRENETKIQPGSWGIGLQS